ncbi:DUF1566 domain-containing protein [Legionella anisa]|uniref:DUF1566 domain-containing protein n=1 Tax=Legionella anisa TaxID=28082 RepID=A0AAX0WZ18_9GAMM|nr:DUF1566 domain-containing protein [Legionella anisa]AWN72863.1 DUF1566 domain-containing protein [Legionella anisa]KTC70688.1 hypothetical protein Lani_2235 [Legionella anisa]MBN5934657.1 DUF1566 domain-containing protein [Legionella anisa]MCW8423668.1 DUF1566 domain-containing protein [Legionella anisa]MCW8447188.1 DUF1566 domain-containing protein [Legionella anisa]
MRLLKLLPLYFFVFFIVPFQSLWALESAKLESSKTVEKAHLTISANKNGVICGSKSLQNCVIQVSQLQCLPSPGTVIITNNSRVPANNIQATSTNGFFSLYVLQNNSCPASLLPGRSCAISFFTNTSIAFFIPSVMVKGTNTNATFFDMQAIQCAAQTTLSAPANAVIPTNDSVGVDITVNNLTSTPALNVRLNLPPFWTNVTSSTCAVIPANGSCIIHIASTALTPFAPQGGIPITGDNVISPPTMALAFSINGFLIYSVVSPFAHVIANTDFNFPGSWSADHVNIPGITETSTSPPDTCNGATDGFCNTQQITSFDPMSIAAGSCFFETVPMGTWYLPSICELGTSGGAGCSASTSTIFNLFSLGFNTGLSGQYWSSTESSVNPTNNAWFLNFAMGAQGLADKSVSFNIRCARAILLS